VKVAVTHGPLLEEFRPVLRDQPRYEKWWKSFTVDKTRYQITTNGLVQMVDQERILPYVQL